MLTHFLSLNQAAFTTAGIVLLPVLAAVLIVGLVVGIFQAATQIQEMTLSFLPKLLVLGIMVYVGGPWFLRILTDFMRHDLSTFWHVNYLP